MGPDSQWGDTRDGFGVSGIHEIQRNPNFFPIVGNPAILQKTEIPSEIPC